MAKKKKKVYFSLRGTPWEWRGPKGKHQRSEWPHDMTLTQKEVTAIGTIGGKTIRLMETTKILLPTKSIHLRCLNSTLLPSIAVLIKDQK